MPYGFYISAEGAHAQSARVEVLANNLANVDTVGFKRDLAVIQARYAEAVEQGLAVPDSGGPEDLGGGTLVSHTKTDFSAGPLKHTRAATDAAIDGEGFFVVQKGEESFLTRAGDFRLTSGGELVTQQGYAVLSDVGVPIILNPGGGPWEIDPSGAIRQGGVVQNFALVRPGSVGDLVKTGENLFRSLAEPQALAPAKRRVLAGYLEGSAVQPVVEMTALIEASRVLEANINLMKSQDHMLGELVNRLLKA